MSVPSIRQWPRSVLTAATLISVLLVCGILYWAQVVLVPIVLAALLTFLLSPVVSRLDRWGMPRVPGVVVVVSAAVIVVGGIGYVVVAQAGELAAQIPDYKQNIKDKIADIRSQLQGGPLEKVQTTIDEIGRELKQEKESADDEKRSAAVENERDAEEEPVPVQVQPEKGALALLDADTLAPVLRVVGTAGLVVVLVIFMLIKREDLRSRLVSLTGQSSLAVTTKALDEAGRRISRYLLMQFVINVTYGTAVGIGLFAIGVPYAVLWGLCAAALRYIPYVGPWVAALLPITVGLITFPGWTTVLSVVGLFIVLELISNNFMEPWLYGHSVGLSEIAVIIAAVFWTWLWGPIGLILATPMTVCLVVLGKYIPALSFLDRLLGQRPALTPHALFYQRLLAHDEDEATEIAEEHAAAHPLEATFDELLVPTLSLVQRDKLRGHITGEDEAFVLRAVEHAIEDLAGNGTAAPPAEGWARSMPFPPKVLVIGFPARDRADELALKMLSRLLGGAETAFKVLSADILNSEKLSTIEERDPACVCVVSVPPGDLVPMRQVCKRLRARFPELRILAGRLGAERPTEKGRDLLRSAGPDRVTGTLAELRQALAPLIQFYQHKEISSGNADSADCRRVPARNDVDDVHLR